MDLQINQKKNQTQNEKPIKNIKLSEGTYGCIFRPGYQCNGKPNTSNKFITKIQRSQETSSRESEISELIRKIDHNVDFFSPIVEKPCLINLAKIEDEEIKKCSFLNGQSTTQPTTQTLTQPSTQPSTHPTTQPTYESNKIRYIGKRTLADQIFFLFKKNPKNTFKHIFESHMHLLDGFKKLLDAGIIHFDVKENNIICETHTNTPIIIDFGLSFEIEKITKDNYRYAFFTYGPDYGPWCIDICFLTFIANKLGNNWQDKIVDEKTINQVISDFFNQNDAVQNLLSETEQKQFQTNLKNDFIYRFVKTKTTWKQMADYLIKFNGTWDNYSVCVIFLYIIKDMNLEKYIDKFPKLREYISLLKTIITSLPEKRMTIDQTKESMIKNINIIKRKDNREIKKDLMKYQDQNEMKKQEEIGEIHKKILKSKIDYLKKEKKL
jgi:hypothetical protein